MDRPLLLAIDYDGVLHNPLDVKPGYKLGQPIEGAAEAMRRLKSQGAIITIHSVWANTEQKCQAMSKWCRYFDIPYDFITNTKPIADAYVDDKAIRFNSWEQTMRDIATLTPDNLGS